MPEEIKIAVGSDHAGFALKEKVRDYLASRGYDVEDLGTHSEAPVDYPDYAEKVATLVASGQAALGVLVCGTGIGMAISANKVPGIRAATCNDTLTARLAREHNNANVLAMGGRILDPATAEKVVGVFLSSPALGGRHERRVNKVTAIEQRHHLERTL